MSEPAAARPRSRRRIVWWVVLAVLLLLFGCGVWVTARAFQAKGDLQTSVALVSTIQSQIAAGDAKAATVTTAALEKRVHAARAATSDPIWRAAEIIPVLGANLTAVRELSSVASEVTDRSIRPLARIAGSLSLSGFKPADGVVPLQPLVRVAPTITAANAALQEGLSTVRRIDTSGTLGVVTDAVSRLRAGLQAAGTATDALSRATRLLPDMLGLNGPRTYLLVVQNNAEARSTGGIVGALALIRTQDGAIRLVQQASSSDFPNFPSPVLPLPAATQRLYGDITGEFIQDVTLTPSFPLSAELAREMWKLRFGTEVDGVISIDPVALSYLLTATGPVTVGTGDELTSDNVVRVLLSEAYARYSDPLQQNAFFASVAAAVFEKVARGGVDPRAMVTALARAGAEHRILLWSAHATEQSSIAQTTLAGTLPVSSPTHHDFGVYLNDATGAKMDYYLHTSVQVGMAGCRADKRPNYSVSVTLSSSAPADAATTLPPYVTGAGLSGVAPGDIHTAVAVYAPPGAVLLAVQSAGKNVAVQRAEDEGHAVAHVFVRLTPGQSVTFDFQFVGASAPPAGQADSASVGVQATPGVSATEVRRMALPCSATLR
ncbi:MAG: DUF4012 domain-containing protein [Microbacteriaceae bacterium]|nr:MAG: DUF4012 domain-containing protein [Microbacteriaceae bacterium]